MTESEYESIRNKMINHFIKNEKGTFFEVKHRRAIGITSFYLIQQDLQKAIKSIKKAVSLSNMEEIEVDDILISSLWVQAIMCYSRCFTSSDDGFSKLEINNYYKSPRSLKIHKQLMNTRNSYLAHRGINKHETSLVLLNIEKSLNERTYLMPTAFLKGHFFTTYKSKIRHIESIERKVQKKLNKRIHSLDRFLEREIFRKI